MTIRALYFLPLPFFFFLAPAPGAPPAEVAFAVGAGSTPSIASAAGVVAPAEPEPLGPSPAAAAFDDGTGGGGGGASEVPAIFSNKSVLSAVKRFRVMLDDVVCLNTWRRRHNPMDVRPATRTGTGCESKREQGDRLEGELISISDDSGITASGRRATDVHVVGDLERQFAIDRPKLDRVARLPRQDVLRCVSV